MASNHIHLQTNIETAVNAINAGEVLPVTEYGGTIIVFNTSDWAMGNIIYTIFNIESGLPIASFHARPGKYHTVQQVIHNPIPKTKIPPVTDQIPGGAPNSCPDPTIIPGCYVTTPTQPPSDSQQPLPK